MMAENDYHMFASILSQPAELLKAVERNVESAISFASKLKRSADCNLYLVGTGSSLHAAEIGAYFLRGAAYAYSPVRVMPISSYEFVNYTPPLRKKDAVVVVSHRGYKSYSNSSLRMAVDSGCHVAAVTGFDSTISDNDAEHVMRTVGQEKSSAHTVSLTTALGVLYSISVALSMPEASARKEAGSRMKQVSAMMEGVISDRESLRNTISGFGTIGRIWITGSGPNKIVAREGALKIQETCYLDAYGFEVEQMIHGPVRAASITDDLFIPVIWGGVDRRSSGLASAIHDAGGKVMAISNTAAEKFNCIAGGFDLEENLSPFVTLIPMQLTALYLAVLRGTNPDNFRKDEPHFAILDSKIKL